MIANTTLKQQHITEELAAALDSKFFKALSEPVRVQILKYLILNGRSDIAAIAKDFPQDRSMISRHLQLMSEAGILKSQKITRHMFYEIDGPFVLGTLEGIVEKTKKYLPACCPPGSS
ncbi:MAG: winged helix-turn-helix transcriptional regulator [Desulfobacterales bacterium]|nr:MAG: winged helix-turn-helix transcriptional regulator [Desulfobacterales bacterium]